MKLGEALTLYAGSVLLSRASRAKRPALEPPCCGPLRRLPADQRDLVRTQSIEFSPKLPGGRRVREIVSRAPRFECFLILHEISPRSFADRLCALLPGSSILRCRQIVAEAQHGDVDYRFVEALRAVAAECAEHAVELEDLFLAVPTRRLSIEEARWSEGLRTAASNPARGSNCEWPRPRRSRKAVRS